MSISIEIIAARDANESSVHASGSVRHIITDTERTTFGIGDRALKQAVATSFGRAPDDAFVRSPTPWGDLYKSYDWREVETVLVVESATIRSIDSKPTTVKTATFANQSSVTATYNVSISQDVANTSESTWSQTNTINVTQSFHYQVGFLGTEGGGETSFSYSHDWGESKTESTTVTLGSSSGVTADLDPGQSVVAELTADRGTLNVRIIYNAYLTGGVAVNYSNKYQGHHFWWLNVDKLLKDAGLVNSKKFTEDIQVGHYSNDRITLRDLLRRRSTVLRPSDIRPGALSKILGGQEEEWPTN